MRTIIHLKTARVYSTNADGSPKVERITIKLEDGDNFKKFVNHMHLKGYLTSEPPVVEKVLKQKTKGRGDDKQLFYEEIDKEKWQAMVEAALVKQAKATVEKVDYKAENEVLTNQLDELTKRLEALETDVPPKLPNRREQLLAKADELAMNYPGNISNEKLLERIKEIEFDFEIKE